MILLSVLMSLWNLKTNKTVEIRIKIRGNDALAGKTAKTFEEACDETVAALRRQLKKVKEKERGL